LFDSNGLDRRSCRRPPAEKEWDWWVVITIRERERTKPRQHPVGITGHGAERLASMLASPADWISPGRADGYAEDPP
jgi:hypothetical protein